MAAQLKDMLIGLFVVIASLIVIGIVLVIKPNIGDGKQIIHVYFNSVAGITDGTQVTLAGKQIGEVASIQQVPNARQKKIGPDGAVYYYYVTLKVDSTAIIYPSDDFKIATLGLLGEKVIAIIPKPHPAGDTVKPLTSNDTVYADSADLLESTVNEFEHLAEKFEETLDSVNNWIQKYGDTVGSAVQAVDITVREIGKSVEEINKLCVIQDIKNITTSLAELLQQTGIIITNLQNDHFFDHLSHLTMNIDHSTSSIASGKGSLGRFIEEDGLYLEINALLSKSIRAMNSINRYGLLFQYNKDWQRLKRKERLQAERMQDPKAFQSDINTNIEQLNCSFNTMKNLTDRLNNSELAKSPLFRKKFNSFICSLNQLQKQVKIYNEELLDLTLETQNQMENQGVSP